MSRRSIALALLALIILGIAMERRWIVALRAQNESPAARRNDAIDAQPVPQSASTAEVERLRLANGDLLKLRSEIRQLRLQKRRLDELRAETERLRRGLAQSLPAIAAGHDDQPFIRPEQYSFSGFATPERALQSLLGAMRQKDFAAMLRCLDAKTAEDWADDNEYVQRRLSEKFDRFADGYRVTATKVIAPDEVVLRVRSPAAVELAVRLKAAGGEWKLVNMGHF